MEQIAYMSCCRIIQSLVTCRSGQGDAQFQDMMAGVRSQLAAKGANQDVQAYVESLLLERHQRQAQELSAEVQKRRALVDHCNKLEVSASHLCWAVPCRAGLCCSGLGCAVPSWMGWVLLRWAGCAGLC